MEQRTIYAVSEQGYDPDVKYSAYFDKLEDAEQFCTKFKENTPFDIIPVTVNLPYAIDSKRSPFMAIFKTLPSFENDIEIELDDYNYENISDYMNPSFKIREFDRSDGSTFHEVVFYFMATGEGEAKRIALRKKAELIEKGQWPQTA